MRGRLGCWSMVAIAGLAGFFPDFFYLAHSPGKPAPPRLARQPVCLEAWVRLRSYRGCPVLAAAGGYRLGIYCFPGGCFGPAGRSNGALVFAGPFPGRAYISERPVPLGAWVHLAGLEGSSMPQLPSSTPAIHAIPATPATSATSATPATPATPAIIAMDGADVTAGRLSSWADPMPLGYDPWEARLLAAKRARDTLVSGTFWHPRTTDCAGTPGPTDGEIGAWRCSRAWRSLSQVAAGRGTPRRPPALPILAPREERPTAAAGLGRTTSRGWSILASGLLLALAMVGAGMAFRRTPASSTGEALLPVPREEN